MHRWSGLTLGILFAVIGVTGSVLALQPEILRGLHPALNSTAVTGVSRGQALEHLLRSAQAADITAIDLPSQRLPAWQAYTALDRRHYFDTATGDWLLTRDIDSDWLLWLRDLHTHLLAGESGEQVLGISGLLLIVLLATGVYLWWPRWHSLRASLRWHRQPPVLRWLSWHRSSGALLSIALLIVSVTGVAMIYGAPVRAALRWTAGEGAEVVAPSPLPSRATPIPWAEVLRVAQEAMPDAELRRIALPRADNAWVLIRARQAGEWHPNGRSLIWIDPYQARVEKTHRAMAQGWGSRLDEMLYPIHGGFVGGLTWLGSVTALGLAPLFLLITGSLLWWTKRQLRHRSGR